eukprot:gene13951-4910_t
MAAAILATVPPGSTLIPNYRRIASYYGEYPVGTGACSLDPLPPVYKQKGWIKVAAGAPTFKKSLGCGMCLKIEASGKPVAKGNTPLVGTYLAVVNDLCGACGKGDLDFYIPGDGKWEIEFKAIDCPDVSGSQGNIQYRFTGSNPWYLKLQITNAKQPTAAVEFFKEGKWHCAKRSADNHFVWSGVGKIDFPLRTRLTSISGETVGGDVQKLINDKDQNSGFQYKKLKKVNSGSSPNLPCHGQGGLVRKGDIGDVTSQRQDETDKGPSTEAPTTEFEITPVPETSTTPGKETGGKGEPDGGTKPGTSEGSQNIEDFCKTRSSGFYSDPTDCQYFIQCANSKTYRKKCPNDLHWNDRIKNCEYPANAGCKPPNMTKRATSEEHIKDTFSRFKKTSKGWASYYGEYPVGTGACSLDPLPPVYKQKGWLKVAAGAPTFKKSLGCGMCLKIEASGKPVAKGNTPLEGTYYAVVNDLCGACGEGDLDFYIPGDGKWEIELKAIDCPDVSGSQGNIQYRFTGSNPWYLKLQITNAKQPAAAVEFFKEGKWHCAKRTADNHFVWSGVGKIDFPLRTRLTSISGETVGGDIQKLINDKDQNSGFQYKKLKEVNEGGAPKLPCHGQGGLVRDGSRDDVTNQGQSESDKGPSTKAPPEEVKTTSKPVTTISSSKETGGTAGTGGKDGGTKTGTSEGSQNIEDFCKTRSSGFYSDPTDCQYFIQCANSKTYRKKCPNDLHWNDKIKNCDYPSKAGCNQKNEQRSTENSTLASTPANSEGLIAIENVEEKEETLRSTGRCPEIFKDTQRHYHPGDCSKFILCTGSNAKTYRCPDGYLFDKYLTKCRKASYVNCNESEKPNSTAVDNDFCLGKVDGFYKMAGNCRDFYKCTRGTTVRKSCSEGLLFNPSQEECDWPTNVKC